MKKNIKVGAISLLLVLLPGSLAGETAYSSSGGNVSMDDESTVYQANNVIGQDRSTSMNFAEGATGSISKSIYYDYPAGSGYPTSVNYEEYNNTFWWMSGTFYFSDIYPIGNGKVRVWYHGELN